VMHFIWAEIGTELRRHALQRVSCTPQNANAAIGRSSSRCTKDWDNSTRPHWPSIGPTRKRKMGCYWILLGLEGGPTARKQVRWQDFDGVNSARLLGVQVVSNAVPRRA
jgi:hypothetical protein